MGIKLNAFMTAYKFRKTAEEKEEMVKSHIKNEYVPFERKVAVAQAIVDNCYWKTEKDINGTDNKVLHIDSVGKHMLTCMSFVDLYTDIDRSKLDGKMLEDFNTLNGSGVIDLIIQNIDPRELKEFNMVIQMICDDILVNEYEPHAFISKQVERFGALIGATISPILSQLDFSQIQTVIDKLENQ